MENEDEYESMGELICNVERNPERTEFINETDVLIFDESFALNKYNYSAIMRSYNNLRGKIVFFLWIVDKPGPS